MLKTRVIIADDDEDSLDILGFYVRQHPDFCILDRCRDGEELLNSILSRQPDAVLLDIHMPKMSGMEVIAKSLKIKSDLLFVFISGYEQYAIQAFDLSAVDYILKPLEKSRLFTALAKIRKARKLQAQAPPIKLNQRIYIRDNNHHYYVNPDDIIMIEKVSGKCEITTVSKSYTASQNISELLKLLPEDTFFLSHRSYIINIQKISHVTAANQTYIAHFALTSKYAHISKLKFEELHRRMNPLL